MRSRPMDKMKSQARNKSQRSGDKSRAGARRSQARSQARSQGQRADDFTLIPGVPQFAAESLHNYGMLTFEQLRTADVGWLHEPVQAAIERWRDG